MGKKVLICDDSMFMRQKVGETLENAGFEQVVYQPLMLGAAQIVTGIRKKP